MGHGGSGLYLHSCLKLLWLINIYYALTESCEEDYRRKVQEYTALKSSRYRESFSCIVQ